VRSGSERSGVSDSSNAESSAGSDLNNETGGELLMLGTGSGEIEGNGERRGKGAGLRMEGDEASITGTDAGAGAGVSAENPRLAETKMKSPQIEITGS
jgi:hypothetical protein